MTIAAQNPFVANRYGEIQTCVVGAEDRISRVCHFDRRQCLAALALPDLQRTVTRALERRLRQLERGLV